MRNSHERHSYAHFWFRISVRWSGFSLRLISALGPNTQCIRSQWRHLFALQAGSKDQVIKLRDQMFYIASRVHDWCLCSLIEWSILAFRTYSFVEGGSSGNRVDNNSKLLNFHIENGTSSLLTVFPNVQHTHVPRPAMVNGTHAIVAIAWVNLRASVSVA
jgi:hypothetical protein